MLMRAPPDDNVAPAITHRLKNIVAAVFLAIQTTNMHNVIRFEHLDLGLVSPDQLHSLLLCLICIFFGKSHSDCNAACSLAVGLFAQDLVPKDQSRTF